MPSVDFTYFAFFVKSMLLRISFMITNFINYLVNVDSFGSFLLADEFGCVFNSKRSDQFNLIFIHLNLNSTQSPIYSTLFNKFAAVDHI